MLEQLADSSRRVWQQEVVEEPMVQADKLMVVGPGMLEPVPLAEPKNVDLELELRVETKAVEAGQRLQLVSAAV